MDIEKHMEWESLLYFMYLEISKAMEVCCGDDFMETLTLVNAVLSGLHYSSILTKHMKNKGSLQLSLQTFLLSWKIVFQQMELLQ